MKRYFLPLAILIGLSLLAGAAVWAQGAWAGPQWEYLRFQWTDNIQVGIPLTGNVETNGPLAQEMIMMTTTHEDDDGSLLLIELDYLGILGWELVGVTRIDQVTTIFDFKRQKR